MKQFQCQYSEQGKLLTLEEKKTFCTSVNHSKLIIVETFAHEYEVRMKLKFDR